MTIREIRDEYSEIFDRIYHELSKAKEEKKLKLRNRLEEMNLAGMVRRKDNGHIGELHVVNDWYDIQFFPLTKKGEISKRAEHFYYGGKDIEDMFEPYTAESED
jgi:hypothetical protein